MAPSKPPKPPALKTVSKVTPLKGQKPSSLSDLPEARQTSKSFDRGAKGSEDSKHAQQVDDSRRRIESSIKSVSDDILARQRQLKNSVCQDVKIIEDNFKKTSDDQLQEIQNSIRRNGELAKLCQSHKSQFEQLAPSLNQFSFLEDFEGYLKNASQGFKSTVKLTLCRLAHALMLIHLF